MPFRPEYANTAETLPFRGYKKSLLIKEAFNYGGPRWTRTNDQTVMSGLL